LTNTKRANNLVCAATDPAAVSRRTRRIGYEKGGIRYRDDIGHPIPDIVATSVDELEVGGDLSARRESAAKRADGLADLAMNKKG
jgi:hypothetical protein